MVQAVAPAPAMMQRAKEDRGLTYRRNSKRNFEFEPGLDLLSVGIAKNGIFARRLSQPPFIHVKATQSLSSLSSYQRLLLATIYTNGRLFPLRLHPTSFSIATSWQNCLFNNTTAWALGGNT